MDKKITNNNILPLGLSNISSSESDSELTSELESEDELEVNEIVIKGINYIVENNIAYCKIANGQKGQVYGTYVNGKLCKNKIKEIEI